MQQPISPVQARLRFARVLAEILPELDESEMKSLVRWAQKSQDLRLTMAAKELAAALKPPRKRRSRAESSTPRQRPSFSAEDLQALGVELQNLMRQGTPINEQGIRDRLAHLTLVQLKSVAAALGFQLPSKGAKAEKIARLTNWLHHAQEMRLRAKF